MLKGDCVSIAGGSSLRANGDMRTWLLAIILSAALTLGALAPVGASAAASPTGASGGAMAAVTAGGASFAGTRVKVQLVTLVAVLVLVVGVGSAAYLVRKKLGLDVEAPPEDATSPHH